MVEWQRQLCLFSGSGSLALFPTKLSGADASSIRPKLSFRRADNNLRWKHRAEPWLLHLLRIERQSHKSLQMMRRVLHQTFEIPLRRRILLDTRVHEWKNSSAS